MPTAYPAALPVLPADPEAAWNLVHAGRPTACVTQDDIPAQEVPFTVDAASAPEAELRVLAWVGFAYDDDLRDAVATARPAGSATRWHVSLRIVGVA